MANKNILNEINSNILRRKMKTEFAAHLHDLICLDNWAYTENTLAKGEIISHQINKARSANSEAIS